jgi:hypothetical protein
VRRWLGFGGGAVLAVLVCLWLAFGAPARRVSSLAGHTAGGSLEDLLMDLQLIPLDGQAPKAFSLESLDGRRVSLADLAGRPALLYFWATW